MKVCINGVWREDSDISNLGSGLNVYATRISSDSYPGQGGSYYVIQIPDDIPLGTFCLYFTADFMIFPTGASDIFDAIAGFGKVIQGSRIKFILPLHHLSFNNRNVSNPNNIQRYNGTIYVIPLGLLP